MKPISRSGTPPVALHPLSHMFVTAAFAVSAVMAPVESGLAIILFGLVASAAIPKRTGTDLLGPFLRILGFATIFLMLVHAVRWYPLGFNRAGIITAVGGFIHISIPVIAVLHLSRRIRSEELYAFLIDIHVPPTVILILFRTLWLVPRLNERMEETLAALRLRGMPSRSFPARFRALAPSIGVVFSSMFIEISENALIAISRGFLRPGVKSHLQELAFGWTDAGVVVLSIVMMVLACV